MFGSSKKRQGGKIALFPSLKSFGKASFYSYLLVPEVGVVNEEDIGRFSNDLVIYCFGKETII